MLTQHEIGWEEHLVWFSRVSKDPSRTVRIVEHCGEPIGYVQFSQAGNPGVVDWGFYAVPGAARGAGILLGRAALEYGFAQMGVHKVCGQALAYNTASIAFHYRLGFVQEGLLRQHSLVGGAYHDLVCFGLLREDWAVAVSESSQPS